jgi:hypothetical protein
MHVFGLLENNYIRNEFFVDKTIYVLLNGLKGTAQSDPDARPFLFQVSVDTKSVKMELTVMSGKSMFTKWLRGCLCLDL